MRSNRLRVTIAMVNSDYLQLRGAPRVLSNERVGANPWHAAWGQPCVYQTR